MRLSSAFKLCLLAGLVAPPMFVMPSEAKSFDPINIDETVENGISKLKDVLEDLLRQAEARSDRFMAGQFQKTLAFIDILTIKLKPVLDKKIAIIDDALTEKIVGIDDTTRKITSAINDVNADLASHLVALDQIAQGIPGGPDEPFINKFDGQQVSQTAEKATIRIFGGRFRRDELEFDREKNWGDIQITELSTGLVELSVPLASKMDDVASAAEPVDQIIVYYVHGLLSRREPLGVVSIFRRDSLLARVDLEVELERENPMAGVREPREARRVFAPAPHGSEPLTKELKRIEATPGWTIDTPTLRAVGTYARPHVCSIEGPYKFVGLGRRVPNDDGYTGQTGDELVAWYRAKTFKRRYSKGGPNNSYGFHFGADCK